MLQQNHRLKKWGTSMQNWHMLLQIFKANNQIHCWQNGQGKENQTESSAFLNALTWSRCQHFQKYLASNPNQVNSRTKVCFILQWRNCFSVTTSQGTHTRTWHHHYIKSMLNLHCTFPYSMDSPSLHIFVLIMIGNHPLKSYSYTCKNKLQKKVQVNYDWIITWLIKA